MRRAHLVAAFAASLLTSFAFAQSLKVEPYAAYADLRELSSYYANGKLLKAMHYRDPDGSSRVFAFGGEYGGSQIAPKDMSSLHAYGLLEDHGGFLTRWEIKETSGPVCAIEPLNDRIGVQDPLGDGQALVLVAYYMACDGLDPTDVKLIMVYKDHKYAIRGQLPNQPGDELSRKASTNFTELPPRVQKFAWDYWATVEQAAKKDADWTAPSKDD
ncbi:MAG: hypothetical protein WAM90_19330 [Rhodanobacter sp.]